MPHPSETDVWTSRDRCADDQGGERGLRPAFEKEVIATMFVQAKHYSGDTAPATAPTRTIVSIKKKALGEAASLFRESSGLLATEEAAVREALFTSRVAIKAFHFLNAQATSTGGQCNAALEARFEEVAAMLAIELPIVGVSLAFSQPGLARTVKGVIAELIAARRACLNQLLTLQLLEDKAPRKEEFIEGDAHLNDVDKINEALSVLKP